jgi:hypothetical protein
MGKTQQNQSSEMAQQNYNRATGGYDQLQNYLWSNLGPAQDQSKTAYAGASGAYSSSLGSTGAMDPDTYANQSKTNQTNMGTGGYDPAALSNLRGNISANTKTGGYDQSTIDKLDASYGGLTAGGLGGLDPAQTATIRGGYGSLASTGGISNELTPCVGRVRQVSRASTPRSVRNWLALRRLKVSAAVEARLRKWLGKLRKSNRRLRQELMRRSVNYVNREQ